MGKFMQGSCLHPECSGKSSKSFNQGMKMVITVGLGEEPE